MAKIFIGTTGYKLYLGTEKIKLAYLGNERVYSAGNIVTYVVDTNTIYKEEIDNGDSCLSPTTFVPEKIGWTFIGWSESTTASSSVLTSKIMEDEPITLYAVFEQTVTLTYYNGSTTPININKKRYYNNNNAENPSVTLTQAVISGWTARGWSTSSYAEGDISYTNGAMITLTNNLNLYGLYYQTLTLSLVTDSGVTKYNGTRYYNSSSDTTNLNYTVTVPTKYGWITRGWSSSAAANAGVLYNSGATLTLTASLTLYALYYQTITLTMVANGAATANRGTRYYNSSGNIINPSFTVANPAKSGAAFLGWSADGTATVSNTSISGLVLDSSTVRYAVFKCADATINISPKSFMDCNISSLDGNVLYSGIDAALYEALTVTVDAYAHLNFRGASYTIGLICGGGSCAILQPWNDWSVPSVNHDAKYNAAFTIPFTVASGTTNLTISSVCNSAGDGVGYSMGTCYLTSFTNAVLTGRTVVG